MEPTELLEIIARNEDTRVQFKGNVTNADKLAEDLVAFSNGLGGKLIIGVEDKTGAITGLNRKDMGRLDQLIANAASESVIPPINPITENVLHPDGGLVLVVTVAPGINKPYQDKQGNFWVRSGSTKRKQTSREEIQRMFQSAGLVHGDETPANGMTVANLDRDYFRQFFEREYGNRLEDQELPLPKLLENINLAKDSVLNIAGALLFGENPQFKLPVFIVKAVCYPSLEPDEAQYLDSREITGKIADVFQQALSFVLNNLQHRQGDQNINSIGEPEIPRIVLEELLANALIHRDYFVSAPVRVFVFLDRVEILSPGHLPNNLTIENIKSGNSNIRNPILASFATKILPYRGLGNGIRRAIKAYQAIEFTDDRGGNLFKVVIRRPR